MKFTLIAIALIGLTGCTLNDQGITTSADNYVRLTEYSASVPLYGGVTGCQLSTQGDVSATYALETENCSVSVSE